MLFDRDNTTLTCTSTGGPPTTVTWRKNGVPVNNSLYQQSQRVVDTETATYENVLFNDDVSNFIGTFTCEVGNVRGTSEDTVELNGGLCFVIFMPRCACAAKHTVVTLCVCVCSERICFFRRLCTKVSVSTDIILCFLCL